VAVALPTYRGLEADGEALQLRHSLMLTAGTLTTR
jgi:hypothetical protein